MAGGTRQLRQAVLIHLAACNSIDDGTTSAIKQHNSNTQSVLIPFDHTAAPTSSCVCTSYQCDVVFCLECKIARRQAVSICSFVVGHQQHLGIGYFLYNTCFILSGIIWAAVCEREPEEESKGKITFVHSVSILQSAHNTFLRQLLWDHGLKSLRKSSTPTTHRFFLWRIS